MPKIVSVDSISVMQLFRLAYLGLGSGGSAKRGRAHRAVSVLKVAQSLSFDELIQ